MRKAGKIWGETALIHANGVLEFHRIEALAQTQCSKHKHQFKWNGFYVETGHLIIRVWQKDYDLCDVTHLRPGDFMQVKPGLYHSFEALKDTIAFELYWAEFNHDDIVRETVGGQTNANPVPTTFDWKSNIPEHDERVCGHPGCTNWTNLTTGDNGMVRCPFHYEDFKID